MAFQSEYNGLETGYNEGSRLEIKKTTPRLDALPETNSKFAPENGWLEDDPFLLGQFRPIFRGGKLAVSSRECNFSWIYFSLG